MSRAFVKENDLEHAGIDIPERPISLEKNYVTPFGLEQLKITLDNLAKEGEIFSDNEDKKILQNLTSFSLNRSF